MNNQNTSEEDLRQKIRNILLTGSVTYDNSKGQILFSADTHVDAILALFNSEIKQVNRFEVIDHTPAGKGRVFTKWEKENFKVELKMQDNGKTLKVFLKEVE